MWPFQTQPAACPSRASPPTLRPAVAVGALPGSLCPSRSCSCCLLCVLAAAGSHLVARPQNEHLPSSHCWTSLHFYKQREHVNLWHPGTLSACPRPKKFGFLTTSSCLLAKRSRSHFASSYFTHHHTNISEKILRRRKCVWCVCTIKQTPKLLRTFQEVEIKVQSMYHWKSPLRSKRKSLWVCCSFKQHFYLLKHIHCLEKRYRNIFSLPKLLFHTHKQWGKKSPNK